MKRSLQNRAGKTSTPDELVEAIFDNWKTFSVIYIQNLYQSLPQRILACFDPKEPHKVLKVCEFSFRVENDEYITLSEVTLIDVRHFYANTFGKKLYDCETRSR